jgi:hypothetical protein
MPVLSAENPPQGCEFDAYCGDRLFAAGKLRDVTKTVSERAGLFRVEPVGGFKRGHAYRFEYGPTGASVEVVVDDISIELPLDEAISFGAHGDPTVRPVVLPGNMDPIEAPVCVQDLRFELPLPLERYRDSNLFFPELQDWEGFTLRSRSGSAPAGGPRELEIPRARSVDALDQSPAPCREGLSVPAPQRIDSEPVDL